MLCVRNGAFLIALCVLLGIKKLQEVISNGEYFVALESDDTDDARVGNEYLVTVDMCLIPKVSKADGNVDIQKFHVKIDFPKQVNGDTMSVCIDQVPKQSKFI